MNPCLLAVAAALAGATLTVSARPAVLPPLSPQIGQAYVHPHALVDIGNGRKINLYCSGEGSVTVIFDSGLSDWSSIWALVQPAVATRTRACTYDRAGMGYSDVSGRPSTPLNIVADLHQLLLAAGIQPPYLLVGHSLGGFNMKLYAATYRSQVAGMVLVDPSEERGEARVGSVVRARFGDAAVDKSLAIDEAETIEYQAALAACATEAAIHDLSPTSESYKACTDPVRSPLGVDIAAEREVLQVRSAYQAAQASEFANSVYQQPANHLLDAAYARAFGAPEVFGDMPLVVLSRSIVTPGQSYGELASFVNQQLHAQTASLSTHGVHRIVPETHHNIEVEQPQAIIDAIEDVLDAARH
jgi:pimeloyl-ACP methyl ester carboxylesterase